MVKISYAPTEELVVHDLIEIPLDDMLRGRVTPAGIMPLYWCNGILFTSSSLPLTEDVTKEYLRGRIHWLEVQYARMPEYKPVLSLHDDEYKSTINVRVINTDVSNMHQAFVKWLKANTKG
jgi:hypothetical protein